VDDSPPTEARIGVDDSPPTPPGRDPGVRTYDLSGFARMAGAGAGG